MNSDDKERARKALDRITDITIPISPSIKVTLDPPLPGDTQLTEQLKVQWQPSPTLNVSVNATPTTVQLNIIKKF